MENPIKIDDLGVPLFLETPILKRSHLFFEAIILGYCSHVSFWVVF